MVQNKKFSITLTYHLFCKTPDIRRSYLHQLTTDSPGLDSPSRYLKDRDYELNLFDKTLKEIMNIPIEVEIERHEMKEAIVFARLGIDFLKLKELDVRIDMLTLAEQNVGNSSYLTKSDKNIFSERIKELKAQLEQQKEALITGSNPNELEPLDALKFEQIDEITPLYNQIQESKKYVL